MDNLFSIVDIIVLGYGIYSLYAFYLIKYKDEIKTQVLLGGDVNIKKCKDRAAYIAYISPRLFLFGTIATLDGAIGIINSYLTPILWAVYIMTFIFFVTIIWFIVVIKKSVKKFW